MKTTKLTLTTVKAELSRIGVVIKRDADWGEYRVNFRNGREGTAYYTGDLQDALDTGRAMIAQQVVS